MRQWIQMAEAILPTSNGDVGKMPVGVYDPAQPIYLRIGTWNPNDPYSNNYATGGREIGISVYEIDANGDPTVPSDGDWAEDDLYDRIRGDEHPFFIVQGRVAGWGHDGEPVLDNPAVVGFWEPSAGSRWNGVFRSARPK